MSTGNRGFTILPPEDEFIASIPKFITRFEAPSGIDPKERCILIVNGGDFYLAWAGAVEKLGKSIERRRLKELGTFSELETKWLIFGTDAKKEGVQLLLMSEDQYWNSFVPAVLKYANDSDRE